MNKKFVTYIFIALLAILAVYGIYWQSREATILPIEPDIVVEEEEEELVSYDQDLLDRSYSPAPIKLASRTVVFGDGTEATFALASAFDLSVAAENLGKVRFIAKSPDGRIFAPDMVDWHLSREGRIVILEDFDDDARRFESQSVYLSGLRGPNSVAFYTDLDGNGWIYIALTEKLIRYSYSPGDMAPSSEPQLVTLFPNSQSSSATGIVWHITRTILFENDVLYVSVGSGCNACEQPEDEMRAMIITMDPDGGNTRVYAKGLRNAVGFAWADDSLYATTNGVDHLGDNAPDDVMYKITEDENYGWPYCYESGGVNYEDTARQWEYAPISCKDTPLSFVSFGAHSAPLGLTYFENAHPLINNTFLAALHGSYRVRIGNGYRIVRVLKDGTQETFMDGFLDEDEERVGRPVHILQNDENSFFFTDDFNGRLYYVYVE